MQSILEINFLIFDLSLLLLKNVGVLIKMKKHRLFISYYHEDENYRNKFEEMFGDLFINASVKYGEIDDSLSEEYIKRVIREKHISNSTVLVVLVGPKTFCRKHVDWEIYAGLYKNAGLIGLILPNHNDFNKKTWTVNYYPPRLEDNLKTSYAKLYHWTENYKTMLNIINDAFNNRNPNLKDNSRIQMKYNRCE